MNRRDFAKTVTLATLGLFSGTMGQLALPTVARSKWDIFTPEEIAQRWRYAERAVWNDTDGKQCYVRTWKLKVCCAGEPDLKHVREYQRAAAFEINRIGLTHVHCVKFIDAPIVVPGWTMLYCAFVRGFRPCRLIHIDAKGRSSTELMC
jgi:hypothetical protein